MFFLLPTGRPVFSPDSCEHGHQAPALTGNPYGDTRGRRYILFSILRYEILICGHLRITIVSGILVVSGVTSYSNRPPSAAIARLPGGVPKPSYSDFWALGLLRGMESKDIVPDDISILGYTGRKSLCKCKVSCCDISRTHDVLRYFAHLRERGQEATWGKTIT